MRRFELLCLTTAFTLLALAGSASAAPIWKLQADANAFAQPGSSLQYHVWGLNNGDSSTSGEYQLTLTLPSGISGVEQGGEAFSQATWACTGNGPGPAPGIADAGVVKCLSSAETFPDLYTFAPAVVVTEVDPGASGPLTTSVEIAGGGATQIDGSACGEAPGFDPPPCATASRTTTVTSLSAPFGIDAFDGAVTADPSGAAFTQAGGHPYEVSTQIDFNTAEHPTFGQLYPAEPVRDISVDLPPGLVGNPTGVGECTMDQLAPPPGITNPICPAESQVGLAAIRAAYGDPTSAPFYVPNLQPVFNMATPPDVPARFGMNVFGTIVSLDAELRSGSDYGLTVNVSNISEGLSLYGTTLTFWGFPADASHDSRRFCPETGFPPCDSNLPNKPFFRLPTACPPAGQGLTTTVRADSWVDPGDFASRSYVSHDPPGYPADPSEWGDQQGPTGCDQVPFDPAITVSATSPFADSPTGLDFDLAMPQSDELGTISQADVKDSRVTLPEGMVVNPAAASGLVGCSQAQVGLDDAKDPACPDASKIGKVEIVSPQLDDPLEGSIYQAEQFDNPTGALLGFYTVAKGPGLIVKLSAHVERDPQTGRLTTVFTDSPQLPFNHYRLSFDGGPQAPLINPPTCGTKTTEAVFTSWARPAEEVERADSFQIDRGPNGGPCPSGLAGRPFDPQLEAGSLNPLAGATSPFLTRLTRSDGEQRFAALSVSPPPGVSAYLKGVPYCPQAALDSISRAPGSGAGELASPACPAASRVGTVTTGAGAGPLPFHLSTGKVYLAGPYKGAPLSLAIVVPAIAGPIDLGSVVVRAAIHIDPVTAQLRVVSDPLPQIIEGIPLSLRDVRVDVDRPGFTVNPTSCEPMSVGARVSGSDGASAEPSVRFQLGGCERLGFKPKLSLRLKGPTGRTGHPRLIATLKARQGDANIDRARVTLPRAAFLDQSHIRTVCTRVQFAADACPPGSIYGRAVARSPLLDHPLSGPVYLRSSDNTLPDLVVALKGPAQQPIEIELAGRTDAVRGALRNTFSVVPDAPVSSFRLELFGGKRGLVENSRNLCARAYRARVEIDGQNGKVHDTRPVLRNSCGKKAKRAARQRAARRNQAAGSASD